ncbi:uncharacterized protein LOC141589886 [Silene latifolia]|uniref:uncharacterized protein LOC141589886 n=1 Tax=Silene latifolia TaxID=37657 RepID=UPI003D77DAE9
MITQVENPNWSSVSLGTNNVDEGGIDCNIEGDEIEGNVQEEDVMLFSEDDDIDVDLISLGLPNSEFTKLHAIDEDYVNSWYKTKDVPYVNGGEFNVGQEFANKEVLREVIISYNVKRNKISKTIESRSHTITYKCGRKPNPCNWYLRATKKNVTSNVFTIVSYKGPHETTCVVKKPSRDHPNLKREFISNAIKPLVEADWGAKVQLLRAAITKEFNFTISYAKAWAAKQKAIADLYGDWEESYAYLPRYLDALKESNPGTVVHFVNKSTHIPNCEQFDRVFWAFGPLIKGFPHCRPIITIDGTHLYGKYNGVLLIAMGVDANEQLYPLCFAIVDKERYNTWSWFLACIRGFITQRQGICVISDRHPGILKAMTEVGSGWEEPFAFHKYCIRHHASNINTMFKDTELKEAFTKTAFQHQLRKFEKGMEGIGAINMNAKVLLEGIPHSKWCLAHDGGKRYGLRTTNMCECFNGVLKGVRFLPIQALVKATFTRVNKYFVERREIARERLSNGFKWADKVTAKIEDNDDIAAHHEVTCYDLQTGLYELVTKRGHRQGSIARHSHTVLLSQRTCTCNKWQNLHYPCSHLMAVCREHSIDSDQYVDPFYSCGEYLGSYRVLFHPVPDQGYWKPWCASILIPNPEQKRGHGRPISKRIHNEMDEVQKQTVTCSLCGTPGHNKRSCPTKNASSSTPPG